MTGLVELFLLDCFRCNLVSALQLEYPLEYNHDTSQLCRTGHDDVSRTRMTTFAFIRFSSPGRSPGRAIVLPLASALAADSALAKF